MLYETKKTDDSFFFFFFSKSRDSDTTEASTPKHEISDIEIHFSEFFDEN